MSTKKNSRIVGAITGVATGVGGISGALFGGQAHDLLNPKIAIPNQDIGNIGDASIPSVGYGTPIPLIYGQARIAGQLIWAAPINRVSTEETTSAGGKGGSTTTYTTTTHSYTADFAVLLTGNEILGVSKIWLNGKLFYENRPYLTGDALSVAQAAYDNYFEVYPGNADHTAPTEMTAIQGAALTPAYKNRSYILFKDLPLEEFGNKIPVVTAQVVQYGTGTYRGVVKPMKIPLHHIVHDLLQRCGLSADQYDCTQLTKTIDGFAYNGTTQISDVLKQLGNLHDFYSYEDGEKLIFVQEPTPLSRPEHVNRCMINEDYLIANAYHDVSGRQGYFPASAGTSEGQFLMIRAAVQAYEAQSNNTWLTLAENMALAASQKLFNISPPSSGSGILYLPHWLFNVREPLQMQSQILCKKVALTYSGGLWTGNIGDGPPDYGDLVKSVIGAIEEDDAFLTWENVYSSANGTSFGAPTSYTVSASGCSISYTAAQLGSPYTGDPYNINVQYTVNVGQMLGVSEMMEAWPHWRRIDPSERDCAVDTLPWAWQCYDLLFKATSDSDYSDARTAIGETIDDVFDIDDGRNWIRATKGSPFSLPGTYVSGDRTGFSQSSLYRNSDGNVIMQIPAGTDGTEAQYGRGVTDQIKVGDTHIKVVMKADGTSNIDLFLQDGTDVSTADRYYYTMSFTGWQTYQIPLASFSKRQLDPSLGWVEVATGLNSGTTIDVVGIAYTASAAENFEVQQIRPLPKIQLPYTKGVAPYTANQLNQTLVDWQGSAGIGYQDPTIWHYLADSAAEDEMVDFLNDSQSQYNTTYSDLGPFIPSYAWDRFDALQLGTTPDTWTWTWPDPNSEWVGYTARAVCALARNALLSTHVLSATVSSNFIDWLRTEWTSSTNYPPTNFPESIPTRANSTAYAVDDIMKLSTPNGYVYKCTVAGTSNGSDPGSWPTVIGNTHADGSVTWQCNGYIYGTANNIYGNYHEPHAVALFFRAAGYLHKYGYSTTNMANFGAQCWNYLESRIRTSGNMSGTWSDSNDDGDWYGFWGAEIITTLSLLKIGASSVVDDGLSAFQVAVQAVESSCTTTAISTRIDNYLTWLTSATRSVTDDALENLVLNDNYDVTRTQDVELPQEIKLSYFSPARDGGQEIRYERRLGTQSNNKIELSTESYMDGQTAQDIILRMLNDTWARRIKYRFDEFNYLLHAGDVKQITRNGTEEVIQYKRLTFNRDSINVEAESYDLEVSNTIASLTSDGGGTGGGLDYYSTSNAIVLDIPMWSQEGDYYSFYAAAYSSGANWAGTGIYISYDGGATYNFKIDLFSHVTYGTTSTALPAFDRNIIDRGSTVTVTLSFGNLYSCTEAQLLAGANKILIGNEILQFQTAALQSGTTYILSNLLRGRYGTNWAVYGHGTTEQVVLLTPAAADIVQHASAYNGVSVKMKAASVNQDLADVTATDQTINFNKFKCHAPAHFKAKRLASNNVVLTWIRRARLNFAWVNGSDVSLDEDTELYRIKLWDALPSASGNLLATYSDSGGSDDIKTYTITSTIINTLYGSPSATIYVSVEQVSSKTGAGNYVELTVT